MAILIQKYKDEEIGRFELGDDAIIFGRAVECSVFIEDPAVSRQHCQVERSGDGFVITDLDSHNGTYVNGQKIIQARLSNGDEIVVGKYEIMFMDDAPAPTPVSDVMLLKAEKKRDTSPDEKWYLTVKSKNFEQTVFLQKSDYLIGKGKDADIELTGWKMAPVQALLLKDDQGVRIINTADKSAISINSQPAQKRTALNHNDIINIGGFELTIFTKE